MKLEIGIYARDGDKLKGADDREAQLCSQYVFELRKPSGAVIHAHDDWWKHFKEQIIDTFASSVINGLIEDMVLPLPTEFLYYQPYMGPVANGHGKFGTDYILRCKFCKEGASELNDKLLCSSCQETP